MTTNPVLLACGAWLFLIILSYSHTGWNNIKECYSMWFSKKYWTNYNTIEFISWTAKGIIIVPGLIFGIQIWQLYFLTLATSLALIWASRKKALPTLVGFNTLWSWISLMVIFQHLVK